MSSIERPYEQSYGIAAVEVSAESDSTPTILPLELLQAPDGSFLIPATQVIEAFDNIGGRPTDLYLRIKTLASAAISFADNRVNVNLVTRKVMVDGLPVHLDGLPYQVLADLAVHLDEHRSPEDLYQTIWRETLPTQSAAKKRAINDVSATVKRARNALGSELRNPRSGAIRTAQFTRSERGYYATSSLVEESTI
jgi:hypothetical protein